MRFLRVWVSFCAESGAGRDSTARPRPQGGAAARCPSLCFPSIPQSWAGSRDRLGDRGRLGTCLPGLGRARRHPLVSRGKMSSLSFSSSCGGPEVGASRPFQRSPTPTPGSFLSLESAPEAGRRRGSFSRPNFSAVSALSQSAPQESEPGHGTRKPLQIRPREGPCTFSWPRWGDQVVAECGSGLQGLLSKGAVGPSVPELIPAARTSLFSPT